MPRVTRRVKRRHDKWGDDVVEHLNTGHCFPCMINEHVDHGDDAIRKAWEELKHQVLQEFVREHPGERPWAWWQFDAPGRRERTDDGCHPFDCKERSLHVARTDIPDYWKRA